MDSDLIVGLRISLLGLSITFLAMGLVILVMVLLLRLFPVKNAGEQADEDVSAAVVDAIDEQVLEEMAVALAVGICLLERGGALEYRDPSLGKLLEE